MGLAPELTSALLTRLIRESGDGERHEICGLLRGRGAQVLRADAARNVSPTPADSFEIDPQALIAAHRAARRKGALELLGYYHSHPGGVPIPSARDAAAAAPDGKLWLIVTHVEARLWRAVTQGAVHGRFDAVRFTLRTGARREPDRERVRMPDPPSAPDVQALQDRPALFSY